VIDYYGKQVMTAHELAKVLLAGPDHLVRTEGCDCYGEVGSVEVDDDDRGEGWTASVDLMRPK
jgi:hypothetical protein